MTGPIEQPHEDDHRVYALSAQGRAERAEFATQQVGGLQG